MDLSIIVPNFNGSSYLEACLLSLINQETNFTYEIIVIDDCSTDDSISIINKIKYNNFKKILKSVNKGLSDTRNSGLEEACGKFICFVDSDDFVSNNYVDRMIKTITNNDIGICDFISVDSSGELISYEKSNVDSFDDALLVQLLDSRCSTVVWDKIYRKDIIDKYNIRFMSSILNEDILFNFEYMSRINSYSKNDSFLIFYRQHYKSITKSYNVKIIVDMYVVFDSVYKKLSDNMDFLHDSTNTNLKSSLVNFYIYYILIIGFKRSVKIKSRCEMLKAIKILIKPVPSFFDSKSILKSRFNWKRKTFALFILFISKLRV
jgi:glycosyltransferase involved in cell wall biosynthesis